MAYRDALPPMWVRLISVIFTGFAIWLIGVLIGGWFFPVLIGVALGAGVFDILSRLAAPKRHRPPRRPH